MKNGMQVVKDLEDTVSWAINELGINLSPIYIAYTCMIVMTRVPKIKIHWSHSLDSGAFT